MGSRSEGALVHLEEFIDGIVFLITNILFSYSIFASSNTKNIIFIERTR